MNQFISHPALFNTMAQYVDAIWSIDLKTEIITVLHDRINPPESVNTMTIQEARALITKHNHPDDVENATSTLNIEHLRNLKTSETGESRTFSGSSNGKANTLIYTNTPEFDEQGNTVKVYVTFKNIQEKIDSEEENNALSQVLQVFQQASIASHTTIFIFDTKKQSILVNSGDAENWGVMVEQPGVPYEVAKSDIVSAPYKQKYIELHEKMMNGADSAYGIIGLCDTNGTEGLYELNFYRIFDKDGNPTDKATGIYRNITEFSRAARKARAIADALGNDYDHILVINTEDRTVFRHKTTGNIWEALGLKDDDTYNYDEFLELWCTKGAHPEDADRLRKDCTIEKIVEELDSKKAYTYTIRSIINGKLETFQCTHQRLTGTQEIICAYRNIDVIIENEKRQRQAIQDALAAAEHANHAKTNFLNNMSHDIRTPMNAILGFTALATSHVDNRSKVLDYLKKIQTSSSHLLSLINDILDMSRIESGKVKIEEAEISLPLVMHDIKNIVQADIKKKNLAMFFDTVDVQNENIWCDKTRVEQILLNCLSNSIKFTPANGAIGLKIIQLPCNKPNHATYQFKVKDTGIGMSPELMEHLFEPFERERNSTVSGIQGTGLGMAITKNIVDMMNGTIHVESVQNEGTEFTITLTFRIASGSSVRNYVIPELKSVHALVADDNFETCDSVTKMLQEIGLRPEWTLSGKEAVLRAKHAMSNSDPFGVYIIDWLMPDMNGVEVVRRIRQEIGDDTPIIILTAYDWTDIEEEALAAGVTAFCAKPLFLTELHDLLSKAAGLETQTETEPDEPRKPLAGLSILLVEDNPMNQEIASDLLSDAGASVVTADNGIQALELLEGHEEKSFDLILMDIQMPLMDGYDTTRKIRMLPESWSSTIPIIAMTANAFEEDRQKALEAGMNAHIAKPVDVDLVFKTIREILPSDK